eukprot:TRINITY_DN6604_c0_g1_i7.p1 TRINITY_DN6604_c0_g1~~TRINITY_DN6604_c0_g1_i7.p1  ORF type:complete len:224 (-),score=37.42 TRINITY_DN6604_c0_g1_i7:305-976(-)
MCIRDRYTDCSEPCGGGAQTRSRRVLVSAMNGGIGCPQLAETRGCNTAGCTPIDCVVNDWGQYTQCSKTCGGGTQFRVRQVTVEPKYNGGACPPLREERECNQRTCQVVSCAVSQWSEFSDCTKSCGGGDQKRTRTVVQPAGQGGVACPKLNEIRVCNTQGCPVKVDCLVGDWTDFSTCDKTCGGGLQTRTREVEREALNGGTSCPVLVESRKCNTQGCVDVQ